MSRHGLALAVALAASGSGMILVISGVLVRGVFLPGVMLIGAGSIAFAVAAVLAPPAPSEPARARTEPHPAP